MSDQVSPRLLYACIDLKTLEIGEIRDGGGEKPSPEMAREGRGFRRERCEVQSCSKRCGRVASALAGSDWSVASSGPRRARRASVRDESSALVRALHRRTTPEKRRRIRRAPAS